MTILLLILGAAAGGFLGRLLDRRAERDREAAGPERQEESAATS